MSEQCTEQCAGHMPDAMPEQCAEHMHVLTNVTDVLTEKVSHLPETTSTSVTRAPAYGDVSLADPIEETPAPDRWHCTICDARGKGGMDALHAHYMLHHWVEREAKP